MKKSTRIAILITSYLMFTFFVASVLLISFHLYQVRPQASGASGIVTLILSGLAASLVEVFLALETLFDKLVFLCVTGGAWLAWPAWNIRKILMGPDRVNWF